MTVKMGASEERASDKIYLEPTKFKSGANGATTWVHFDVTRFSVFTLMMNTLKRD